MATTEAYGNNVENQERNVGSIKRSEFMDLWDEYVSQHSDQALRDEFEQNGLKDSQRKFAIGFYSCPLQTGNRMHDFTNSLIWAILTNRTLLWKYYDKETCDLAFRGADEDICPAANKESDCAKVLERAKFLPSYDYWSSKLELPTPTCASCHKEPMYWFGDVKVDITKDVVDSIDAPLVIFRTMLSQNLGLLVAEKGRNRHLHSDAAKERAKRLLSESLDFIYGALFFTCFKFHPSISVPPVFPDKFASNEGISVVLHSRHESDESDGSDIERETRCLHQVLNGTQGSCQVSLLSDRPKTIENIDQFLATTYPHCTALVAPHDVGESFKTEHGPFAGVGFFQDLALVTNQTFFVPASKSAFVGANRRSSAKIVKEVMTYQLRQRMERDGKSGELLTCFY